MPTFCYRFPVRFADVDHAGIVYYPHYYHYCHQTFEEFFRQRLGPESYRQLLDERGIGFPAVHSECDYRGPLRFADTVEIEMGLERMGAHSLSLRYKIYRVEQSDKILVAAALVVCALTDLQAFRAVEVPEDLRALFLELSDAPG